MSGGSYDYLCHKVEEMADSLEKVNSDPRRTSFQKLLILVAKAMHDIEWVDSCDYGPGDDHASIDAVFAFLGNSPDHVKKAAAYDSLKKTLDAFFKTVNDRETPLEKADNAYEIMKSTVAANKKICELGMCMHEEHQRKA